jgi:Skp family chaperone for outer membrane proteins
MNKGLILPLSILLSAIIVVAGIFWAVKANSFKIGIIDVNQVSKESELGKKIDKDILNKREELQTKFQSAKTETEKNSIGAEFDSYQNTKKEEFLSKVKQAIATVSKRRGIKAVGSPQVFIYSSEDITQDVTKELNKK